MSDEESTQEIDIDALRERARSSVSQPDPSEVSSSSSGHAADEDQHTVLAPAPKRPSRRRKTTDSISVEIDVALAPEDADVLDENDDDIEDVSEDDDVSLLTNDSGQLSPNELQAIRNEHDRKQQADTLGSAGSPLARFPSSEDFDSYVNVPRPQVQVIGQDDAPSMIGTIPGHDVAQALRAMMGDVPDTPLPDDEAPPESKPTWEPRLQQRALSLDEGETATRLPSPELISASQELPPTAWSPTTGDEPLPAFSLDDEPGPIDPEPEPEAEGESEPEQTIHQLYRPSLHSLSVTHTSTSAGALLSQLPSTRPVGDQTAITRAVPDFSGYENEPAPEDLEEALEHTRATARGVADFPDPEELPPSIAPPGMRDTMAGDVVEPSLVPATYLSPSLEAVTEPEDRAFESQSVDVRISEPEIDTSGFADESIEEADIEEIVPDEMIDDDEYGNTSADVPIVQEPRRVERASFRPPPARPSQAPPPKAVSVPPADPEAAELIEQRKWSLLVAHYRQRLSNTDGPNRKAAILVKIAKVYEEQQEDINESYNSLFDAFEIAPDNEEVVAELDRVADKAQRLGELADKVKKRLVPGAPDEKRVAYLAHVVYWYERKLSRGSEVSSLISDIERVDKVHPLVLKRLAQIAGMNSDTKTQREHLARALERTVRVAEKVTLELALASAWAGTPEAMKHYEIALQLDPRSIVALQGVKRLGKEKELYPQVKWALERQADVAQTEAERIDAMLELAELEETKFLKRELAAQLLEQVLTLEPAHPQALKGLERCYHALRDWPALARILAQRAEHAFEKRQKVELFELAAEVHEGKLGDPAGAVEVYKNLLIVEPKHRRALTDLGRLYEKLGDWDNVALYKARLAELATSKRTQSQELMKLGDFLNTPERDPLAAKLQYERAVTIDPTNAAAWEAIQRIATENGDINRVIECLEQRKKHTEIPRQRAMVLVELARVQTEQGDEDGARKSFEAAIRADGSNEAAAVYMLDSYTADERWQEAAPLCELLVNAAIRDRDHDALFIRLRLQTRIAAALGDADRALTASMAALDAQPMDPGAQADLLAVASQCSGSPSLTRAKESLLRVAASVDDLTNEQIIKLALLQRELKDLDSAARCYEAARRREPDNHEVTKELSEIYLEQADYPRACKLKVDMARNAANPDVRFALFCEAGEIWAKRADELEKAASVFEEARQIKPQDPKLLETLRALYTELSEWELVAGVLEDMIQSETSDAKQLESVLALAELAKDKLNDSERALDANERALDLDRKRLDIFEGIVRHLTEEKDWDHLERSYRKMIARVKDDDEPQLQFLLFHQLGLIYRDRLGDASRAFDALDAASRLEPENVEVRKIVIELLIVTDNLDNAVARVRDEIDRDPHQPELYAELYELFLRQHFFDKAWCCVNVLARLQIPTADQRRFHEDYAPMPLDRVPGQIVEQAWKSHIFHVDLDPALTNILAILTPAVARMRFGQLRPEQRVGRPFTPNHSRMHQQVRETFDNASEILAVEAPELLVADLNSVHPFAPALAPYGAVLVCGPAIEAQSVSLIYLVGKKLAEHRPELAARSFFPAEKELGTYLAAAMRVARNEGTKDPTGSALDSALGASLSPQEMAHLRNAMMQALADNAAFDVKRWLQLADLSSMRAGLLIAGDIEPARQAIGCEVSAASDLAPREKLGELLRFAVSDLYSDLRGAIGVSVQS